MTDSDVTLVVLSCGRFDLLNLTITAFFAHNDYPIAEVLVTEDSGLPDAAERLHDIFSPYPVPVRTFVHESTRGIIACMDELNRNVRTDYILHLEDDWICTSTQHDYIQRAKQILEADSKILQVWLRPPHDCNGHPLEDGEHQAGAARYRLLKTGFNNIWHGYSNNPNLRRLADYKLLGPGGYGGVPLDEMERREIAPNFRVEAAISEFYFQCGFRAAVLVNPDGGFIHVGVSRSVLGYEWSSAPTSLANEWYALVEERDSLAAARDATAADRDALRRDRDKVLLERNALASERDTLAREKRELTWELDRVSKVLSGLLESTSWRLTKPLRVVVLWLRKYGLAGANKNR